MVSINRAIEPGFCGLITTCQIVELVRRIAQATVHFFAVIATDLYETLAWSCEKIYNCITCNYCESKEVKELEQERARTESHVEDVSRRRFPNPVEPNESTNTLLSQPTLEPTPITAGPEQTFEKKVSALLYGLTTMDDLQAALNTSEPNSEEARVYNQVIESRNVLNAAEDNPTPSLNAAPDIPVALLPDDDENHVLLPAPGTQIAPQPLFARPKNMAPMVISESFLLAEDKIEENKAKALARIQELQNAVEVTLSTLKEDIPQALAELAEIDTGTPKGTLKNAPEGVLQRLKEMPLRIPNPKFEREKLYTPELALKTIPNPDRTDLWPEGTRAADRYADLERTPDKALLRLAELKTFERLFHIRADAIEFDLDLILEKYDKPNNSTQDLKEWFGFAYPAPTTPSFSAEARKEQKAYQLRQRSYQGALDDYESNKGIKSGYPISNVIAKYLSNIHNILRKKKETIEKGSAQEKAFKESVQAFIDTMIDANANCPDQMASQLEDRVLHLLADELPGNMTTPLDEFKFKMALVLTHYRAQLVTVWTRRLYPDEDHMADLERRVKRKLAEDLGLKGEIYTVEPKYHLGGTDDSPEKISAMVFNEHNPLLFLMDYFHLPNHQHEFYSIRSLRDGVLRYVNRLCGLDGLDEYNGESKNDPLNKALSVIDEDDLRASSLGPLTFPGVLFYLEASGILIRQ